MMAGDLAAWARLALDRIGSRADEAELFVLRRHMVMAVARGLEQGYTSVQSVTGWALRVRRGTRMTAVSASALDEPDIPEGVIWEPSPLPRLFPDPQPGPNPPVATPGEPQVSAPPSLLAAEEATESMAGLLREVRALAGAWVTDAALAWYREDWAVANTWGVCQATGHATWELELELRLQGSAGISLGAQYAYSPAGVAMDIAALVSEARDLAVQSQGERPLPRCRLPVVLGPHAMASLLDALVLPSCLCGSAPVPWPADFSLIDDPVTPRGLNHLPFDDTGVPTATVLLYGQGQRQCVLGTLPLATASGPVVPRAQRVPAMAVRRDVRSRPRAWASNVVLQGPTCTVEDLLELNPTTLYVPIVVGARLTPQGGFTCTGFNARLYQGSTRFRPVAPCRIEGSLDDLLGGMRYMSQPTRNVRPFPWWSPAGIEVGAVSTGALCVEA